MKIVAIEDFHADGGWRTLSFIKVTTDAGIVGWSEFHEGTATPGLTAAIMRLSEGLIGTDPRSVSVLVARLNAATRNANGGLMAQAIAAIENACVDIKARALDIAVCDLLGGAFRRRLPLYWSQCGTLRTRYPDLFGSMPLQSLDDVVKLGQEVAEGGYRALKTNILLPENDRLVNYRPGFGGAGHPELNLGPDHVAAITDLLAAFRQGAGEGVELMLDINFNLRPEGVRRVARAVAPLGLKWLELDLYEPDALAMIRSQSDTPVASLESLYGRRAFRPFLDAVSVDFAIIDPQWNGILESMRMAALAESHEVNVAPHNFHGPLSTLMGAHFAAAVPNLAIVEYVVDEAPWISSFLTEPIRIEGGDLILPEGPGWGSQINEAALASHPAKARY